MPVENLLSHFTITDRNVSTSISGPGCVRLSNWDSMPKDLASNVSGVTTETGYPRPQQRRVASNNPPKDYAMWGELVRKFTEHLVERYLRSV